MYILALFTYMDRGILMVTEEEKKTGYYNIQKNNRLTAKLCASLRVTMYNDNEVLM